MAAAHLENPHERAPNNQHEFDGYHNWWGISNKKRPPSHYEHLAISLDEDEPEGILAAVSADGRRAVIRAHGQHGKSLGITIASELTC